MPWESIRRLRGRGLALAVLLNLALLIYVGRVVPSETITSPDVPWHLTSGRIVVETGAVPRVDPICFTSTGIDWINLNWLAQAALYKTYQTAGFAGLLALEGVLCVATLCLFLLVLREMKVDVLPALVAVGFALVALLELKGVRPRALTFLLLMGCAWILSRRDPDDRLSWASGGALLAGLVLWNHLHGGFVYGYALLACDAAGTTLEARWRRGVWITRRAAILGGVVVLGLLSFALHPHGFDAPHYAATYMDALDESIPFIAELQPLDFNSPEGRFLEAFLLVLGLGLYTARKRPPLRALLVLAPFLHLALTMRRGTFPLVLLGAPLAAWAWTQVLARFHERLPRLRIAERRLAPGWSLLPATLATVSLLWAGVLVARDGRAGVPGELSEAWPERSVVGAARWIRDAGPPGRIYNFYDAGGLLGWALYPQRRITIDGRSDVHARGSTYVDYLRVFDTAPGWKQLLDEQRVQLVVMPLPPAQPPYLLRALLRDHGWKQVYVDDTYVVLQRPRRQ